MAGSAGHLATLMARIRRLEYVLDEEVDYHRRSQATQALKLAREELEELQQEASE